MPQIKIFVYQSSRSVQAFGRPVQTKGRPVQAHGQSVQTRERPVQTAGQPVQPLGPPVQTFGRPVHATNPSVQRQDNLCSRRTQLCKAVGRASPRAGSFPSPRPSGERVRVRGMQIAASPHPSPPSHRGEGENFFAKSVKKLLPSKSPFYYFSSATFMGRETKGKGNKYGKLISPGS
jgi:hypothetical protein